jgi:hypothetical protein
VQAHVCSSACARRLSALLCPRAQAMLTPTDLPSADRQRDSVHRVHGWDAVRSMSLRAPQKKYRKRAARWSRSCAARRRRWAVHCCACWALGWLCQLCNTGVATEGRVRAPARAAAGIARRPNPSGANPRDRPIRFGRLDCQVEYSCSISSEVLLSVPGRARSPLAATGPMCLHAQPSFAWAQ